MAGSSQSAGRVGIALVGILAILAIVAWSAWWRLESGVGGGDVALPGADLDPIEVGLPALGELPTHEVVEVGLPQARAEPETVAEGRTVVFRCEGGRDMALPDVAVRIAAGALMPERASSGRIRAASAGFVDVGRTGLDGTLVVEGLRPDTEVLFVASKDGWSRPDTVQGVPSDADEVTVRLYALYVAAAVHSIPDLVWWRHRSMGGAVVGEWYRSSLDRQRLRDRLGASVLYVGMLDSDLPPEHIPTHTMFDGYSASRGLLELRVPVVPLTESVEAYVCGADDVRELSGRLHVLPKGFGWVRARVTDRSGSPQVLPRYAFGIKSEPWTRPVPCVFGEHTRIVLPVGKYRFAAPALLEDVFDESPEFEIEDGADTEVPIVMRASITPVRLRAIDPLGEPVPTWTLELSDGRRSRDYTFGYPTEFAIVLPHGTLRARVSAPGFRDLEQDLVVREGTGRVDLRMVPVDGH